MRVRLFSKCAGLMTQILDQRPRKPRETLGMLPSSNKLVVADQPRFALFCYQAMRIETTRFPRSVSPQFEKSEAKKKGVLLEIHILVSIRCSYNYSINETKTIEVAELSQIIPDTD